MIASRTELTSASTNGTPSDVSSLHSVCVYNNFSAFKFASVPGIIVPEARNHDMSGAGAVETLELAVAS